MGSGQAVCGREPGVASANHRHLHGPVAWRAFQRVALDGESATEVARELGVSVNAVFIAKSRVLARLREEVAGLVDS